MPLYDLAPRDGDYAAVAPEPHLRGGSAVHVPATTAESRARADIAGWLEELPVLDRAAAEAALASAGSGTYCFRGSSAAGVVAVLCYKQRDGVIAHVRLAGSANGITVASGKRAGEAYPDVYAAASALAGPGGRCLPAPSTEA